MKIGEEIFRSLSEIGIEDICKMTCIDMYSKKLKLIEHVKLLASYVVLQCSALRELTENSHAYDSIMSISASQLSKVNNSRDYTAFVLVFYALLCHPTNYRKYWRFRRFLGRKILGDRFYPYLLPEDVEAAERCLSLAGEREEWD